MTFDAEAQALAHELVGELGKGVTLVRTVQEYDPGSGTTIDTDYDVPVVATPPRDFTIARLQDTLIQQGDTAIDVPAQGLDMTSTGGSGDPDPQQSDHVDIDGSRWEIVQIGRIFGGSEVALWRLHLRR